MIGYNEKAERENLAQLMHDMEHIRKLFAYEDKDIFAKYAEKYHKTPEKKKEKEEAVLWWYINLAAWVLEKQRSGRYAVNFFNDDDGNRRLYSVLAGQEWKGGKDAVPYVMQDLVDEEEAPVLTQDKQEKILQEGTKALTDLQNIEGISQKHRGIVAKIVRAIGRGKLIRSRVLRNIERIAELVKDYKEKKDQEDAVKKIKECIEEIPALEKRISTREIDILLEGLETEEKQRIKRCIAMQYQIEPTRQIIFALMELAEEVSEGKKDSDLLITINKRRKEIEKRKNKSQKFTFDVIDNEFSPLERAAEAKELGMSEDTNVVLPAEWRGWTPEASMLLLMMHRLRRNDSEEDKKGMYMVPGGQGSLGVYEGILKTSSSFFKEGMKELCQMKQAPVRFCSYGKRTLVGLKEDAFEKIEKVEEAANKKSDETTGAEEAANVKSDETTGAEEAANVKSDETTGAEEAANVKSDETTGAEEVANVKSDETTGAEEAAKDIKIDPPSGNADAEPKLTAEALIAGMQGTRQVKNTIIAHWEQATPRGSAPMEIGKKKDKKDMGPKGFMLYDDGGNHVYRSLMPKNTTPVSKKFLKQQANIVIHFLKAKEFVKADGISAVSALEILLRNYFNGNTYVGNLDKRAQLADLSNGKKEITISDVLQYAIAFLYKGSNFQELSVGFAEAYQGPEGFSDKFQNLIAKDNAKELHKFVRKDREKWHALVHSANDNVKQKRNFSIRILPLFQKDAGDNLRKWMEKVATAEAGTVLSELSEEEKKLFTEMVNYGFKRLWASLIRVNKDEHPFEVMMGNFVDNSKQHDRESGDRKYTAYALDRTEDRAFQLVCTYMVSFETESDSGYKSRSIPKTADDFAQSCKELLGKTQAPGWKKLIMKMYDSTKRNAAGYTVKLQEQPD